MLVYQRVYYCLLNPDPVSIGPGWTAKNYMKLTELGMKLEAPAGSS